MTKLLAKAHEAVRRLPPGSQDEIARAMLTLAGDEGESEAVDPAHLPAALEGLTQAKRRQFATDARPWFLRCSARVWIGNQAAISNRTRLQ
jgi:hypothetical protein